MLAAEPLELFAKSGVADRLVSIRCGDPLRNPL